jgi:hypothetical protein
MSGYVALTAQAATAGGAMDTEQVPNRGIVVIGGSAGATAPLGGAGPLPDVELTRAASTATKARSAG